MAPDQTTTTAADAAIRAAEERHGGELSAHGRDLVRVGAAAVIAELERWDVGLAKSIADGGAKMHAPLTVQESIEAIRESLRARIEQLGGQTEATP